MHSLEHVYNAALSLMNQNSRKGWTSGTLVASKEEGLVAGSGGWAKEAKLTELHLARSLPYAWYLAQDLASTKYSTIDWEKLILNLTDPS